MVYSIPEPSDGGDEVNLIQSSTTRNVIRLTSLRRVEREISQQWLLAASTPKLILKPERRAKSASSQPTNSRFLPVVHPALETGIEALAIAAQAWLAA